MNRYYLDTNVVLGCGDERVARGIKNRKGGRFIVPWPVVAELASFTNAQERMAMAGGNQDFEGNAARARQAMIADGALLNFPMACVSVEVGNIECEDAALIFSVAGDEKVLYPERLGRDGLPAWRTQGRSKDYVGENDVIVVGWAASQGARHQGPSELLCNDLAAREVSTRLRHSAGDPRRPSACIDVTADLLALKVGEAVGRLPITVDDLATSQRPVLLITRDFLDEVARKGAKLVLPAKATELLRDHNAALVATTMRTTSWFARTSPRWHYGRFLQWDERDGLACNLSDELQRKGEKQALGRARNVNEVLAWLIRGRLPFRCEIGDGRLQQIPAPPALLRAVIPDEAMSRTLVRERDLEHRSRVTKNEGNSLRPGFADHDEIVVARMLANDVYILGTSSTRHMAEQASRPLIEVDS